MRRLRHAGFTAEQARVLPDLHTPNFMEQVERGRIRQALERTAASGKMRNGGHAAPAPPARL